MGALSVSLQAKGGLVDAHDMADLLTKTQQLLDAQHPLAKAIVGFKVQTEMYQSPERLAELGEELSRQVLLHSQPKPPGSERKDING